MEAVENKILGCASAFNNWNWNMVRHVQIRLHNLEEKLKMAHVSNYLSPNMDRIMSLRREINSLLECNEVI